MRSFTQTPTSNRTRGHSSYLTVAPSVTAQCTLLHAYEAIEAFEPSLMDRGIARAASRGDWFLHGGGIASLFFFYNSADEEGVPLPIKPHMAQG